MKALFSGMTSLMDKTDDVFKGYTTSREDFPDEDIVEITVDGLTDQQVDDLDAKLTELAVDEGDEEEYGGYTIVD